MAKAKVEEATQEAPAGEATVTEAKQDERYKMITLEDGTEVKRIDYIRKLYTQDKMSRGDIARKLSELTGKKVAYQIVFSATKGLEGGPAKEAAAPTDNQPKAE